MVRSRCRVLAGVLALVTAVAAGCAQDISDTDGGDGSGGVEAGAPTTEPAADAPSSTATSAREGNGDGSDTESESSAGDQTAAGDDASRPDDEQSSESDEQQAVDGQQAAPDEGQQREAEEQTRKEQAADAAATPDPCAPESLPGAGVEAARTISSGGNEYEYLVYVPGGLDGPAPLVLNFHGLGGDGPGQAHYTGYRELAERERFVVIHPSGLFVEGAQGLRSWELAQEAGLNPQLDAVRDDLQFVRDLLDEATAQLCIDPERIYSTGMSNGGGFSSRLVCEFADRIAAAFAVTLVTHPPGCMPSQPVAFAAVHGTADDIVPFYGTGESPVAALATTPEEREAFREFFSQVMPDELAEFAADFNCQTTGTSAIGEATTLTTYTDCDDGVEARFYAIDGFGHEWPSLPEDDFSASEEGWSFMSGYTLSGSAE